MTCRIDWLNSCNSFLLIYFFRLIGQDFFTPTGGIQRFPGRPVTEFSVMQIAVPIHFQLTDLGQSSLRSFKGLFRSSAFCRFKVRLYVGVSVKSFHHVLRGSPWPWFKEAFLHGNLFGAEECLEISDLHELELFGEESQPFTFNKPSDRELNLGQSPRERYPFVICCVPLNNNNNDNPDSVTSSDVGAVLNVVHVRDEVFQIPTQILSCHLKHVSDGRSTQLQTLFVDGESSSGEPPQCCICQTHPVTIAILPCRHACVCRACFGKLKNRCPMCRTQVTSFFSLGEA